MCSSKTFRVVALWALMSSIAVGAAAGPVGAFESNTDVGAPKLAGSSAFDAANNEYTITGAGSNMWTRSDQFQFLWRKMSGDFILRARLEFVGKGKNEHRKIGWMVRSSLDADAPYVDCAVHGVDLTSLQYRPTKAAITDQKTLPIKNPDVIEFERRGSNYLFSAAHNGKTYVTTNNAGVDLP